MFPLEAGRPRLAPWGLSLISILLTSSPKMDAKEGICRVLVGTMLDLLIQEGLRGAANLGNRLFEEVDQCNVVDAEESRRGRYEGKGSGSNFLHGKEEVLDATSDA